MLSTRNFVGLGPSRRAKFFVELNRLSKFYPPPPSLERYPRSKNIKLMNQVNYSQTGKGGGWRHVISTSTHVSALVKKQIN